MRGLVPFDAQLALARFSAPIASSTTVACARADPLSSFPVAFGDGRVSFPGWEGLAERVGDELTGADREEAAEALPRVEPDHAAIGEAELAVVQRTHGQVGLGARRITTQRMRQRRTGSTLPRESSAS